jgi:histone deacetylase 1/2
MTQKKYSLDLLQRAGMLKCKTTTTPMSTTDKITAVDGELLSSADVIEYMSIVGGVQYLTITRPDISYAVNRVFSIYMRLATLIGLLLSAYCAIYDLQCLIGCIFGRTLSVYSDADWAGSPDDRRSTGGYVVFFGSNLIAWSARKQATVSHNSTEAEYKAVGDATAEIIWVQSLLQELGLSQPQPPILWCDNIGATYFSANPVFHARMKHIEVDYHFVRERMSQKRLLIKFISYKDQLADIFTKHLPLP